MLACLMVLLLPASAAMAKPREQKLNAHLTLAMQSGTAPCARCGPDGTPMDIPQCSYEAVVEFAPVRGAKSYSVSVYDSYYRSVRPFTGPPFYDNMDGFKTPSGVHWFGLSGGGGGSCQGSEGELARYRIVKAVAIVPKPPQATLSGKIVRQKCSARSCSRRPASGVTVVAKPVGDGSPGHAVTGKNGRYRMRLKQGQYLVTPVRVRSLPAKARVSLNRDVSGVDFHTCGGARRAAAAAFLCSVPVIINVRDLSGAPLPNVEVLAYLGKPRFDSRVPPAAHAFDRLTGYEGAVPTDANGNAKLELWETEWTIKLVPSLRAVNPSGGQLTLDNQGSPNPDNPDYPDRGYASEVTRCDGGSVNAYHDNCFVNLDISHHPSGRTVRIGFTAGVYPVDVSVPPGYESSFISWTGFTHTASPPRRVAYQQYTEGVRRQFRFELPSIGGVFDDKVGDWKVDATAPQRVGKPLQALTVDTCQPSIAGPQEPNTCALHLIGPGSAHGTVAFGRPPR